MTILTIPDTYADACQSPDCGPGDPPPSLAIGFPRQVPGGVETDHGCSLCPAVWSTTWDHEGWVIRRMYADVREIASREEAA